MRLEAARIGYVDEFCLFATWRHVAMHVMGKQKLPPESARELVRVLTAHGKACGEGKMAEITLVAAEAPLPDANTRKVLDSAVPIVSPYYCCVSAVFEGSGFTAAIVRAFVTSFQLLSRSKYPQKVFSSIDDAATWTLPQLQKSSKVTASTQEFIEVVHDVREHAVERGIVGGPLKQPSTVVS
ncbi:MAG: hypothetical protein U0414_26145 [Polyangiaceae bacterium]